MRHYGHVLFAISLLCMPIGLINAAIRSKHLKRINEENWRDILEGEWMIQFHAPWCPACRDLHKAWSAFADWGKDLNINVGEIDVTDNPGLSGRFLITSLPTIYHVKDGQFRLYGGPRDTDDFIWFVEEDKWQLVDTIPSWKYPDSVQMSVAARFFKLSMAVRDQHNHLVEHYGIPAWGSFGIFASATLLVGSILGFIIVHIIDRLFPTKPLAVAASEGKKQRKKEKQKQQSKVANGAVEKSKRSDIDSENDAQNSQSEGDEAEPRENGHKRKKESKSAMNGKAQGSSVQKK